MYFPVHMEKMCGQNIPNADKHGTIVYYFSPANLDCSVTIGGGRMGSSAVQGFMLVFQEVNLSDLDCDQANISVEQSLGAPSFYDYDYDYGFQTLTRNNHIPGLCSKVAVFFFCFCAISSFRVDTADKRLAKRRKTPRERTKN